MNGTQTTLKKPTLSARLLSDLQIAVWAILALFLVILLILETRPTPNQSDLTVSEPITVNSSIIDVHTQRYSTTVRGSLYNPTNEPVTIDSVTVSVITDDKGYRVVEFDGFVLHPRMAEEITHTFTGGTEYQRVSRVAVTVNGEERVIVNTTNRQASISGAVIFFLILLVPVLLLLTRAIKIRYYLYQEKLYFDQHSDMK